MTDKLEYPGEGGPEDALSLYLSRGEDVSLNRPLFTGDIFALSSGAVIVLQHPCALRVDGVSLVPILLAARVDEFSKQITKGDWRGNYRQMLLPAFNPDAPDKPYAATFTELDLIGNEVERTATRLACLSQIGVNLLLQRWVHHNSRVIVPTFRYQEVTSGPLEECDLTEEWADESVSADLSIEARWSEAHDWLRGDSGDGRSRQRLLEDPQNRAGVRRQMRDLLKSKI